MAKTSPSNNTSLSDKDWYLLGLIILALYIKQPLTKEALDALVHYLDQFLRDRKNAIIEFAKEVAKEVLGDLEGSKMVHITTK